MQEAMEKITNILEDRLSQSRAGRLVKKTEAGVPIPARGSVEETGPIEDTSVNAMHKPQQAKLVAQPSNVDFLYEANTVEVSVPIAPAGWHGSGLPLLLLIWRPCRVTWLLFQVDQSLGRARVLATDTGGEVHVVVAGF
jgi:hypothetical protein